MSGYTDLYGDPYGGSEPPPPPPPPVDLPIIFNKFEYTGRTTDADPIEYAKNLAGNMLMRHYGAQPVGVNVYVMSDGTFTEADPTDWDIVDDVLWGGHETEVSLDLATRLVGAGYSEWLENFSGYIDIYEDIYS